MRKRLTKMLCFLAGVVSATIAGAADPVHYIKWDWSQEKLVDAVCTDYEVVTASTARFEKDKWYVVNSDVHRYYAITVPSYANLILCDGAKLTVDQGIWGSSCNLWVYGQSAGTGILEATGGAGAPGIGGYSLNMIVFGGIVRAKGGPSSPWTGSDASYLNAGAGIGSTSGPARFSIYGGQVFAIGGDADYTRKPGLGFACYDPSSRNCILTIKGGIPYGTGR